MPVATAENISPSSPSCCQKCHGTQDSQHQKSFNPCSTTQLQSIRFMSCFPPSGHRGLMLQHLASRGSAPCCFPAPEQCSIVSCLCKGSEAGESRLSGKLHLSCWFSEVWLFVFACFSYTRSDRSGNTLCCGQLSSAAQPLPSALKLS